MQRCNFSLHNFVYPEKQGGGCGGFGINTKKLCKLKLSDAGRSEGSKVDKGGTGWEFYRVGGRVYYSSAYKSYGV